MLPGFSAFLRARVDRIGKPLSRRLINVRVMRGFPERAGIRRADKAVFLALRPRERDNISWPMLERRGERCIGGTRSSLFIIVAAERKISRKSGRSRASLRKWLCII